MQKNVKIVCTLGPVSATEEKIREFFAAGMDVARLNFSHGSTEEKEEDIRLLRSVQQAVQKPLAIIADLQGPKIRFGVLNGIVVVKKEERLKLSISPVDDELPVQFDLSNFVEKGQRIFANDGLLEFVVGAIDGKTITVVAQNNGWISSHKGINLPDTDIGQNTFSEKDREDALFALEHDVDYIALSFVRHADDINSLRALIDSENKQTKIIVKIEKMEAIKNLEAIVSASDGIMVARGDLAIETKPEIVPILQQKIMNTCRHHQKPVIIATQMLVSMTENPRPTRAETSDVANAVIDQVDAVMLSEETASGKYPVEAVQTMESIIHSVEENPDYKNSIHVDWAKVASKNISYTSIASATVLLAKNIHAKAIVAGTATGHTVQILASFRPEAKIIAVVFDTHVADVLNLVWGVHSLMMQPTEKFDEFLTEVTEKLRALSYLQTGDKIVLVTGSTIGTAGGTDTIKVVTL